MKNYMCLDLILPISSLNILSIFVFSSLSLGAYAESPAPADTNQLTESCKFQAIPKCFPGHVLKLNYDQCTFGCVKKIVGVHDNASETSDDTSEDDAKTKKILNSIYEKFKEIEKKQEELKVITEEMDALASKRDKTPEEYKENARRWVEKIQLQKSIHEGQVFVNRKQVLLNETEKLGTKSLLDEIHANYKKMIEICEERESLAKERVPLAGVQSNRDKLQELNAEIKELNETYQNLRKLTAGLYAQIKEKRNNSGAADPKPAQDPGQVNIVYFETSPSEDSPVEVNSNPN